MTVDRLVESVAAGLLFVGLFAAGVVGYHVFAPVLPGAWLAGMAGGIGQLWTRVGFTFPFLALFAVYLVVLPTWLVAERLGFAALPFDPRRHLHYVEATAPLLGLLATSLAMGQAMQGFEPAAGMLSTSRFLVQHAGQAMWATATGIAEAYAARTIAWLFTLDERGGGS